MKNLLKSWAAFALLFLFVLSAAPRAQAQNESAAVGKATSAANGCLNDARQNNLEVNHYVETHVAPCLIAPCPVSGYTVTFWGAPKCPGNTPCPFFAAILIAVVELDANGNVISIDGCNIQ